jgi:hypothetical protein
MKTFMSLLVTFGLICSAVFPTQTNAQDSGPDPTVELQRMADNTWEEAANFRAEIEAAFNIKLEKDHAWRTFKSAFPRTAQTVENNAIRRWGIEITELDNGLVKVSVVGHGYIKGVTKDGIPPAFFGRFAPLAFGYMVINMSMDFDNAIETVIIDDAVAAGYTPEYARYHANNLTDDLRYYMAPASAQFLNTIERNRERGADRSLPFEIREQRGQRRTPPPAGHSPYDIGNGFACAPGFHDSTSPGLPPSSPGGHVVGSVDGGTITVTGRDPCK